VKDFQNFVLNCLAEQIKIRNLKNVFSLFCLLVFHKNNLISIFVSKGKHFWILYTLWELIA